MRAHIHLTPKEYRDFKNKLLKLYGQFEQELKLGIPTILEDKIDLYFQAGIETARDRKAGYGVISVSSENEG